MLWVQRMEVRFQPGMVLHAIGQRVADVADVIALLQSELRLVVADRGSRSDRKNDKQQAKFPTRRSISHSSILAPFFCRRCPFKGATWRRTNGAVPITAKTTPRVRVIAVRGKTPPNVWVGDKPVGGRDVAGFR